MVTETLAPSHITIDEKGAARIDGTRMKVIHVIETWKAGATSPELIQAAHPFLSLAQVHAAFAYYYDHQGEIDAHIARTLAEFDKAQAAQSQTPGLEKLRETSHRH